MRLEQIIAEMCRRYVRFHKGEEWFNIKLWGLFSWGDIAPYLLKNAGKMKSFKKGLFLTDYKKENKIIWVRPTEQCYYEYILPMLKKYEHNGRLPMLTSLAGWRQ